MTHAAPPIDRAFAPASSSISVCALTGCCSLYGRRFSTGLLNNRTYAVEGQAGGLEGCKPSKTCCFSLLRAAWPLVEAKRKHLGRGFASPEPSPRNSCQ